MPEDTNYVPQAKKKIPTAFWHTITPVVTSTTEDPHNHWQIS